MAAPVQDSYRPNSAYLALTVLIAWGTPLALILIFAIRFCNGALQVTAFTFAWMTVLLSFFGRKFVLLVPEATVLVTVNKFNRRYYGYNKPGWYIRYPWETVDESNFFSLETITVSGQSEDFPAQDGNMLTAKFGYQFRVSDDNPMYPVARFFASDTTISEGIREVVSGTLAAEIGKYETAIDARGKKSEIETKVGEDVRKLEGVSDHDLITEYGVELVMVVISDLDYEKQLQEAFKTQAAMKRLKAAADELDLPDDQKAQAMEFVMLEHGKNVTRTSHTQRVEGGTDMDKAIAILRSIFGKE